MKDLTLGVSMALALTAGVANAAPPTVTDLYPNYTFEEYSGTATVGIGDVNVESTLFYIDEKAAGGFKSWYIFFDPNVGQRVRATIHFDQAVYTVLPSTADLAATDPVYGAAGVTYGSVERTGLEGRDSVSWVGNQVTIDWIASDPGDHIRVLVAVPEPESYALFGIGLLTLGAVVRRRKI